MMKKVLALALVLGSSSVALAGLKSTYPVTIVHSVTTAYGSMGSARNSADTGQYIECGAYHYAGSGPVYGGCNARDAAGATLTCSTHDPEVVRAIDTISSDSFLQFQVLTDGTCNYVYVGHGSQYEPKR